MARQLHGADKVSDHWLDYPQNSNLPQTIRLSGSHLNPKRGKRVQEMYTANPGSWQLGQTLG